MQPTRRNFTLGAGLLGLALPMRAASAASSGGAFRLTDGNAPHFAALLRADLAGERIGGFEGEVFGFGADGALRPLMAVRGLSRSRLAGTGTFVHEEAGVYCDLVTGKPLEAFRNPFTGALVRPAFLSARIETPLSAVRACTARDMQMVEGSLIHKDPRVQVSCRDHGSGDTPVSSTQLTTFIAASTALASGGTPLRVHGEWMRSGPWPGWLDMEDAPGPCLHHCRFEAGAANSRWLDDIRSSLAGHPMGTFV